MTKKFVRHPKQSIEGMQSNEAEVGLSQQVQALPDIEQQLDGLLETISQDIAVATDLNSDSVKGKVAPPESNRINKILGKNSNKPSDEDWLPRVESLVVRSPNRKCAPVCSWRLELPDYCYRLIRCPCKGTALRSPAWYCPVMRWSWVVVASLHWRWPAKFAINSDVERSPLVMPKPAAPYQH